MQGTKLLFLAYLVFLFILCQGHAVFGCIFQTVLKLSVRHGKNSWETFQWPLMSCSYSKYIIRPIKQFSKVNHGHQTRPLDKRMLQNMQKKHFLQMHKPPCPEKCQWLPDLCQRQGCSLPWPSACWVRLMKGAVGKSLSLPEHIQQSPSCHLPKPVQRASQICSFGGLGSLVGILSPSPTEWI